jgi:hypothetical protein
MTRTRAALIWVAAVGLLLSSCGDGDAFFSSTTAAPTTTPSETTTTGLATTTPTSTTLALPITTTAPAPSTTTPAPTTTAPPTGCSGPGAGPIPAGAEELSSVTAQLDGDGAPDEFTAYRLAGTWYLHARLGSGYATQLALDPAWAAGRWSSELDPVWVDSAHDLGLPSDVIVVGLNVGLALQYGLFVLEACGVVALAGDDGTLPDLWALGSIAHSDWPVCGPGPVVLQVVFGSTADCDGVQTCATPNLSATEYQIGWDPARIVYSSEVSRSSTRAEMDDFASRACMTGL